MAALDNGFPEGLPFILGARDLDGLWKTMMNG